MTPCERRWESCFRWKITKTITRRHVDGPWGVSKYFRSDTWRTLCILMLQAAMCMNWWYRNPPPKCLPLPVATYLTCDRTTASVTYFLKVFQTDVVRTYGLKGIRSPIMLVCDGSMVLMQALCLSFAQKNLHHTINHYYSIATGKGTKADFEMPI